VLPIPKTNAEQFPEVKKLLGKGLQSIQCKFSNDNASEASAEPARRDVEPCRRLVRYRLRIATFVATEPDVSALVQRISVILERSVS
jgi:hypothetical protein